jgi:hypothetical protein
MPRTSILKYNSGGTVNPGNFDSANILSSQFPADKADFGLQYVPSSLIVSGSVEVAVAFLTFFDVLSSGIYWSLVPKLAELIFLFKEPMKCARWVSPAPWREDDVEHSALLNKGRPATMLISFINHFGAGIGKLLLI